MLPLNSTKPDSREEPEFQEFVARIKRLVKEGDDNQLRQELLAGFRPDPPVHSHASSPASRIGQRTLAVFFGPFAELRTGKTVPLVIKPTLPRLAQNFAQVVDQLNSDIENRAQFPSSSGVKSLDGLGLHEAIEVVESIIKLQFGGHIHMHWSVPDEFWSEYTD